MNIEALAYPFLFVAIFFQSFVLVTLFSAPADRARRRLPLYAPTPSVAIIVPCWNEASTVAATCNSLLALDYPKDKLEIILVNDGSTDATRDVMAQFREHLQVRIIDKENGGKHTALNAGIMITNAEIIGCLDADSFTEPNALREIIACFDNPNVVAATAAIFVHKPGNILQHMQNAEYTLGVAFRHSFASVNGLYVIPGPFSFYLRKIIEELGGFRYGHQTEDMEIALRIQRAGYWIENAPRARVYTKTPATIEGLIRQRTRWTSGFLRNILGEYRSLIGNRNNQALGMLVLPAALLSIMSGVFLFIFMLFLLARNTAAAIEIRTGIPLSYAFIPQTTFDWFYIPVNFFMLLAAIVLLVFLAIIIIGKRISNINGNVALGIVSYIVLYGLISPLWLMRAASDVALGKRREWRH